MELFGDVAFLARLQFTLIVAFHFVFVPLSIGIGLITAIAETRAYRSGLPEDADAARFWVKLFTTTFVIGVASGITMEFSFGTNWADYSRFVGDIFGAPLAAEALFAFFLESVFLGVLLFGRGKVSPRFYCISAWLVWFGSCLSALWILIANSWMQTPAGYEVVDGQVEFGLAQDRAKDYFKFMNRIYTDGLMSQDFFSSTNADLGSQSRLDFGLGLNSLVSTAANNTSDIMMNVSDDAFEMAVLPYVSADGGEAHVGESTLLGMMKDNDNWAFSADCADIDPLLDLVEYLFSDDAYLLTNYGVEDVTYTLDSEGKPHYTDLIINNPDGLSYFFASYVYATNAASSFFPFLNDMSRTFYDFTDNQWQVYEDLRTLSDCAWNYPTYAVMTTDETAEYASIESDLSTYLDSKILEFITGSADVDKEWDSFVDTLYAMGLQDMIDLKQDAYDRAMERVNDLTA